MDKLTLENLKTLEKLGYFYEEQSNRFWATDHETYVNLPLAHCNDLVRIMNAILNFKYELGYSMGEADSQAKFRSALGLSA